MQPLGTARGYASLRGFLWLDASLLEFPLLYEWAYVLSTPMQEIPNSPRRYVLRPAQVFDLIASIKHIGFHLRLQVHHSAMDARSATSLVSTHIMQRLPHLLMAAKATVLLKPVTVMLAEEDSFCALYV